MLSLLNVTSVLMEYEDMFPYSGQVAILKRTIAYSEDEIATILEVSIYFLPKIFAFQVKIKFFRQ